MAFQDQTGITTETLGKAMQAATEANGENPLFEMERGEITEVAFLEKLTDEPRAAARPPAGDAPLQRDLLRGAAAEPADDRPDAGAEGRRLPDGDADQQRPEWEPLWRPMLPVDEIFETVVDSGFVGCRKPESKIYALTLERIGAAGRGLPLRRRRRGQLRRRPQGRA